ncbi:MAG: hypothetical protein K2F81_05520 [Ruminococcus sp.]|nr:hypothetical protein [Ruminococcus sp.]
MRNVIKFSENAEKNLIPAWKDYVTHYRVENFSKKGTFDVSCSLEDKEALVNKAIESEVCKLANLDCSFVDKAVYSTNPQYQWATFAVVNKLIDIVTPAIVKEDFMNVAEVTNIGYGDTAEFDIKSADLFKVVKNGNSRRHVEVQKQFTGTKTLVPENHTITTEVDLYRVLAGKESLADYAMKVILSIESEIAIDVMAAVKTSFDTLTTNFKENAYSETAFKKLAQRVQAANGGARVVAIGTELGLGTILPTNDYMKMGIGEEYTKMGYLPVFKNVPLVAISQKINWDSEDYDFALDDGYIYFVSPQTRKLVQIVFEGDTLAITGDQFGNSNLTQKSSLHKRWAVGLITNSKYGIMKTTVS